MTASNKAQQSLPLVAGTICRSLLEVLCLNHELTHLAEQLKMYVDLSSNLERHHSLGGIPVRFRVGKEHFQQVFFTYFGLDKC